MPGMNNPPRLTRQQAIDELRKEAEELENRAGSLRDYARNAYKARIRRELADKLEREANKKNNSTNECE